MNNAADDPLQQFRMDSDRAFAAMMKTSDQEMQKFLTSYGSDAAPLEKANWLVTGSPMGGAAVNVAKTRVRRALQHAEEAVETLSGRQVPKEALGHAAHALFQDMGDVGDAVLDDAGHLGHEAFSETKNILRDATLSLGERARREAQAMREAAHRIATGGTDVQAMKAKAKAELADAKKRMAAEIADVRGDAVEQLEGMAKSKLNKLKDQGLEAADDFFDNNDGLFGLK